MPMIQKALYKKILRVWSLNLKWVKQTLAAFVLKKAYPLFSPLRASFRSTPSSGSKTSNWPSWTTSCGDNVPPVGCTFLFCLFICRINKRITGVLDPDVRDFRRSCWSQIRITISNTQYISFYVIPSIHARQEKSSRLVPKVLQVVADKSIKNFGFLRNFAPPGTSNQWY